MHHIISISIKSIAVLIGIMVAIHLSVIAGIGVAFISAIFAEAVLNDSERILRAK